MAIDYSGFALPKTNVGVKLSASKYRKHKEATWEKQNRRCYECNGFIPDPKEAHLHHPGGRGLGGGKRNDLKTCVLCVVCHLKEHNQIPKETK